MFESLKKPDASTSELLKDYLKAEDAKKRFETQARELYSNMVDARRAAMTGEEPQISFQELKSKIEDLTLQADACNSGLDLLKKRIGEMIPREAKARLKVIETKCRQLEKQKERSFREYLETVAAAIVQREGINGRPTHSTSSGWAYAPPSLEVSLISLHDDWVPVFLEAVEQARKKAAPGKSIDRQLDDLSREMDRLNTLLSAYDSQMEVSKLIESSRSKTPDDPGTEIKDKGRKESSPLPSYEQEIVPHY